MKRSARHVGIHRELTALELQEIILFIAKYFSDFSLNEIKLAFEFMILRELDAYLPQDKGQIHREHYQVFSLEYVTRVLQAYRAKRSPVRLKLNSHVEPQEPTEEEKKILFEAFKKEIYLTAECCSNGDAHAFCFLEL